MKPNTLGFTRRDVQRIQALAEEMTDSRTPPALVDLDVPIRVAAVHLEDATRFSGEVLGEWAGRGLVYWVMTNRERETWARQRRSG